MKLFFLFVMVFSFQLFAQESYEGMTVGRGKIYLPDSKVIEGQYLVFKEDSLEYYIEKSKQRYILNLQDVSMVKEYGGHNGDSGVLWGGILGTSIGVVVALGTKKTERDGFIETTTIQTWPIYLFGAGGALLGYLIGKSSENWKTVYKNDTAISHEFNIQQTTHFDGLSLSYTVHF